MYTEKININQKIKFIYTHLEKKSVFNFPDYICIF